MASNGGPRPVVLVVDDAGIHESLRLDLFDRLCEMNGRRPRIVFLTCINASAPAVESIQRGADGWIVKPWDEHALRTQLPSLLAPARGILVRGGDPGVRRRGRSDGVQLRAIRDSNCQRDE